MFVHELDTVRTALGRADSLDLTKVGDKRCDVRVIDGIRPERVWNVRWDDASERLEEELIVTHDLGERARADAAKLSSRMLYFCAFLLISPHPAVLPR